MVKSICKTNLMILSVVFAASATTGVVVQAADDPPCTRQSTIAECQARIAQDLAILKQLQPGQFVAVYTDNSGLAWSKALPYPYTNGCVDANDQYDGSQCTFETNINGSLKLVDGLRQVKISGSLAAQACDKVGGRLPTKAEIEGLIRNFNNTEEMYGPKLTATGRAEMNAQFGDNMNNWFWSSSVLWSSPALAYVLLGGGGDLGNAGRSFNDYAVRCVSGR